MRYCIVALPSKTSFIAVDAMDFCWAQYLHSKVLFPLLYDAVKNLNSSVFTKKHSNQLIVLRNLTS